VSPARLGALAALVLVALDVAAVPGALPSVRVELGSSTSGLVWIQGAHFLAFALTLVLLARAGVGRRACVAAGFALYLAGALLAATADGTAGLVTGRALQGAGSAALLGVALDRRRGDARRALAAAGLLALLVAPLVGGAVAEGADWRWLFALEPAAAALAALLLIADKPATSGPLPAPQSRPLVLAAGLACASVGLIQSGPWGWASLDTLVLLVAGATLLVVAWRDGLAAPAATPLAVTGCLCAALLFVPQYFELVRGLSPLRSGLLMVVLTGAAAALAPLAVLLARGSVSRLLLAAGLAGATLGALGATRIDPATGYAVVVLSLALLGAGAGVAAGALWSAADPRELVAPGATGAVLIVAAAGALFQRAQLEERDGGGSFEDALSAGLAGSAWLLAAVLAAAGLLALLIRSPSVDLIGLRPTNSTVDDVPGSG
jgi:MFS family permease